MNKQQKRIPRNIKRNYLFILTNSFALTESIWMLYLANQGMTLIQIGLLESIFHLTSLVMEVPTGIIADYYGRRVSRIAGRIAACLATLLMLCSTGFWSFALAFIITAIGYNLESGAGDALIYDTLVDEGLTDLYTKIKGRQEVFFQMSRVLALAIGGFVAKYSYDLAYTVTVFIYGLSALEAFYFTEPKAGRGTQVTRPRLLRHIMDSFSVIGDHRHILPYVLYIEVFAFIYTTLYFYMQSALKASAYLESQIGVILATVTLISVITAAKAYRIEQKLGQKKLIRLGSYLAIGFIAIMAFTSHQVLGFAGLALVDGLLYVTFSNYINSMIPSAHRATLISFQSMVFSALMILCFPAFGALIERVGFTMAFKVIFFVSAPLILWTLFRLKRAIKENAEKSLTENLEKDNKMLSLK